MDSPEQALPAHPLRVAVGLRRVEPVCGQWGGLNSLNK